MWILKVDDNKAQAYKNLLYQYTGLAFDKQTKLKKNVRSPMNKCAAYAYFSQDKVEDYMTARPERLIELHEAMINDLGNSNGKLYAVDLNYVKHVFSYDSYIKGNKEMSYALAHLMDVNTCTYCNRQYTLTVDDVDEDGTIVGHLIRPEFDHWFSQKDYPDLALSYYNLIPACHICNSIIKRDAEMGIDKHIHPYIDKKIGFSFSYVPTSDGYAVDIVRDEVVDDDYYERVENTLELFKLPQIYGAHSGLELKELLELATANHPDYISTLVSDVMMKLGVKEIEAYRILFGIEVSEEDYLKRPMSKFKSDVIKKIKEDFGKKS